MGPATANSPRSSAGCRDAWRLLAYYTLTFAAIAALLTLAATPFVDLPPVKVFRRCASIAAAAALWLIIHRVQRRSFSSYGLGPARQHLWLGLALGTAVVAALGVAGLWLGCYRIEVTPETARLWRVATLFLPAAALISVLEELVFRGFLLQTLLACSRTAAVLVSSGAYSLVHLRATEVSVQVAMELAGLFLLGLVLAGAYLKTGQLWLAVGLHAALAYAARVNKLVMHIDPELWWLGGTNRLINGVLGWAAVLLIGAVIWRWAAPLERGGVRDAGSHA